MGGAGMRWRCCRQQVQHGGAGDSPPAAAVSDGLTGGIKAFCSARRRTSVRVSFTLVSPCSARLQGCSCALASLASRDARWRRTDERTRIASQ